MGHPCKELVFFEKPDEELTEEQLEQRKIRRELMAVAKIQKLKQYDIKIKMDKLLRKISTARKLYRKHKTNDYLDELQNKETLYKELYNEYWYECVYHKYKK